MMVPVHIRSLARGSIIRLWRYLKRGSIRYEICTQKGHGRINIYDKCGEKDEI
jgi:hypothetical protein